MGLDLGRKTIVTAFARLTSTAAQADEQPQRAVFLDA